MKKLWKIIKSEYIRFFRDPGSVLIMVIGVIVYSIFYAIPYSSEVLKDVPIAVMDMDNSNLSREFIQELNANDNIEVTERPFSVNDAKNLFYSNKVRGYIIIPEDFEKDLYRGKQSHISLYADSSYLIIYKSIVGGTMTVSANLGAGVEVQKLVKQGIPKQMAMTLKEPFEFVSVALYNPAGGYATYVYPVILILILHQTIVIGIGLLMGTMKEKERNFTVSGYHPGLVLFGKATAYVLLYLIYSSVYFLFYPAVVNYPMSYNILALFIFLIPFFYSTVFFAFCLSYFYETRESSLLLFVVSSLILIFLPGFIWPKEAIPWVVNMFSWLIPATSGIDGIIKINQMNATFWQVKYDFIALVGLCFFYFVLTLKFCCKYKEN